MTTGLTTAQVLERVRAAGYSPSASTWRTYARRGKAPEAYKKVGRTLLWRTSDIDAWLASPSRRNRGKQ